MGVFQPNNTCRQASVSLALLMQNAHAKSPGFIGDFNILQVCVSQSCEGMLFQSGICM